MQSWADIASDSDDDSVGMHHPAKQQPQEPEPEKEEQLEQPDEKEEEAPPPKEYDWPTEPPFTAYVGNLPYSIKDSDELTHGIEDLLHDRFQATARIERSRLAIDRQENRPRGFGYIELETVEDLKTVMRLNDGKSMFKGRPLKFDVASPPSNQNSSRRSLNRSNSRGDRSGNIPEIDGSSFRGGRFSARRDSNNSSQSSLRRQSSVTSDTSETAKQRPSLKLAPRSKPASGEAGEASGSQSSLFGSGKARDDVEWERRRSETKLQDGGRRGSASSSTGGGSSRSIGGGRGNNKGRGNKTGGRGGGGRGKQGGKDGNRKSQSKQNKPKDKETNEAPKAVLKPPAPATAEPPKPAATKVQNKFSALNMDSDSD